MSGRDSRNQDAAHESGSYQLDSAGSMFTARMELLAGTTKRTRNVAVGTVRKSIDTRSPTWLSRNVLQFCEGGFLRLGIHRETVLSETSIPSFRSSPCTRGAPHRMLALAILRISSRISRSVPGRPGRCCRERRVQYEAKRFRCQRRTVSGLTMKQSLLPVAPEPGQDHPEDSIQISESRAAAVAGEEPRVADGVRGSRAPDQTAAVRRSGEGRGAAEASGSWPGSACA